MLRAARKIEYNSEVIFAGDNLSPDCTLQENKHVALQPSVRAAIYIICARLFTYTLTV